jgi:histidine triad (HIT) family protein
MTIFEQIANHEIPATIVYEDADIIAFNDIKPQAPYHIVIAPRKPIPSLDYVAMDDAELLGKMIVVASELARKFGISDTGYRLVLNDGRDAGQSVDHIHIHLLGGRPMQWPPG